MDNLDIKPEDLWKDLPDARRSHHRPTRCGPCGIMAEVYCVNCGKSGGLITEEWAAHVFYLCDKCAETYGSIPLPEVPEHLLR